jgi:very-short-patch-repair endonuclease
LPVTSPARTLLDLAERLRIRDLERALDEALVVLEIVSPAELRAAVKRASGRAGASVLAKLLDRRRSGAITQSKAERRFLELVRAAGLPEPKTQVRIAGFTVDFFWPEQRVAFEIDGYRYHTSRRAFDRDRRKDAAVKAVDVDPNRVSRDQVIHEPLAVLAYVAGALARAGKHAG